MASLTKRIVQPVEATPYVEGNKKTQSVNAVDSSNFELASKLQACKADLIFILSQHPLVGSWLVNKYGQDKPEKKLDTDDDISEANPQPADSLADIKQRLSVLKEFVCKEYDVNTLDFQQQSLALAIAQYPFGFEDIIQLVDIILSLFKIQIEGKRLQNKKIDQRLALIKQRNFLNLNVSEKSLSYLTGKLTQASMLDLINKESQWLNARKKLAAANSGLVLFIANQYKGGFMEFEDLVQEGQTGLLKAVDKYDHHLGFQFSTYASYWIRQAISRGLTRSERVVRLPFGQMAAISKVYRAKDEYIAMYGREPGRQELADFSQLTIEDINTVLSISQNVIPLEPNEEEEEAIAPINFLEQNSFKHAFTKMAEFELNGLIQDAIAGLSEREAQVICCRFGVNLDEEMTFQEIGTRLNLTRERVRQIQVVALNKIKNNFGEQLMCFL
ncbi:MAG: RNA polymerase sigma factor RpoD/SigA [Methylococcaceae bacterium]|jgi:RNA polymerase sigma factor (sigma-70 family)